MDKRFLFVCVMSPFSFIEVMADQVTNPAPEATNPSAETSVQALSSEQASKVFNASQLKDNHRLFVTGEVLFWKAQEDDLQYAVKSDSSSTIRHGRVKNPEFEWDWGFRAGFGYNTPHDHWDLYTNYTHFYTKAHAHDSGGDGVLFPSQHAAFGSPSGSFVTEAEATWRLHLQLADLELGRGFGVSKWLSLRPFIGVRGAWIYQQYHIEYTGGSAVPVGETDIVSMRNNCWGVGLRFGLDTTWGLGRGLSVFGDGAFSILSGHFNVQQREHLENSGSNILNVSSHPDTAISILELSLGLQYDRLFMKNKYHLGIQLGYEFNYFFDQNQFIRFISSSSPGLFSQNNGDLSLQGVSLGFRFDF